MTFQTVAWILPETTPETRQVIEGEIGRHTDWRLSFHEPGARGAAACAEEALTEGCAYLAFTREARPELFCRLSRLAREATGRPANVALMADRGAQLSFAGLWSPRIHSGVEPLASFPAPEAWVVRAAAYRAVSGLDAQLESLVELDLAWRLALSGFRVELTSPCDDGTPSPEPLLADPDPSDALAILYKSLSDDWLTRVLPWALACTLATGERRAFQGVVSFGESLRTLNEKRRRVQAKRAVSDDALCSYFPEPLACSRPHPALDALAMELGVSAIHGDAVAREPVWAPKLTSAPRSETANVDVDVSVIVLTATGAPHLEACLRSLAEQRFSNDRLEVIVVDNDSPVDPAPAVARSCPDARILRLEKNFGFTGGNNRAAATASGEWLAFVNDDVVLSPGWLEAMIELGGRRDVACVASPVYGMSGLAVDFARGAVSFEGKGFQLAHGRPKWTARLEEEPVLFANGAAMLVRRDVFLELGGFDDTFFAYYEDVSLGWELWLRGHEVWLAPHASARHRQHQSAALLSDDERTRLYERNALAIVLTHLEASHRARALPASLLLLAKRALLDGLAPRAEAVRAWLESLPAMRAKRASIERARKRSDRDVLSPFASRWTHPSHRGRDYRRYHDDVAAAFELEAILSAPRQRQRK